MITEALEIFDMTITREDPTKVRDLATVEECDAVLFAIEEDLASILGQIAQDEADRTRPPGWRAKAQNAMRYKKRLRQAVNFWKDRLKAPAGKQDKRKVLLQVIEAEIGTDEYLRLVEVARSRHPDVFAPEAAA